MSVAVRRALYGKLSGDTTLTNMLATPPTGFSKSIFYEVAPEGATFPYVIFNKQAGTPSYGSQGGGTTPLDNEVWTVKGVDKSSSADVVDGIASRLDALLTDGAISISGKTQRLLRRESDVAYSEVNNGVLYRHSGAMYRLMYA